MEIVKTILINNRSKIDFQKELDDAINDIQMIAGVEDVDIKFSTTEDESYRGVWFSALVIGKGNSGY